MKRDDKVLALIEKYDELRRVAVDAKKEQDEVGTQLKALIGDRTEYPVDGWNYTYRYDKDKTEEYIDEETFQRKEPKVYATFVKAKEKLEAMVVKYVKTKVTKGARRLIIERKDSE